MSKKEYKCEDCGESISEEEHRRNDGYCDDCEDDYWDEEEEKCKKKK